MKHSNTTALLSIIILLASATVEACMAKSTIFQPEPLDGLTPIPASESSKQLDAEVIDFLRGSYVIESARYFEAVAEMPWLAIAKSVHNQMSDQAISRQDFEWQEPGVDFVEVYPQKQGKAAFAVAMSKYTEPGASKLIGFYLLAKP